VYPYYEEEELENIPGPRIWERFIPLDLAGAGSSSLLTMVPSSSDLTLQLLAFKGGTGITSEGATLFDGYRVPFLCEFNGCHWTAT
jgi:hypothetical protein